MLEIVGHRGYAARAPENTLASLDLAIEAGADAVEWDVQFSACGTPVLFHDDTLERTTGGEGPLGGSRLEALRDLDAGGWFGDAYAGVGIPTLAEALDRVGGRVARVYCEVKAVREPEDADRAVEIVRSAGMLQCVVFISLDWSVVERVASLDPAAAIGFILDDAAGAGDAVRRVERTGRGMVDADAGVLLEDPEVARTVLDAGVELGAWTVNDADTADGLADLGVTSFTTDEVERLLAWRSDRARGRAVGPDR